MHEDRSVITSVRRRLCNQRGQAVVFVLAMVGIVLISFIFLYQSGRITSAKMELQNGADAAAYGATVLEARALNFSAYTNRAMVANEVAIGQMVGMLSWADELKSVDEYLQLYVGMLSALDEIPGIGEITAAISSLLETVGEIFLDAGEGIEEVLEAVADPAIRGLSLINEVYSTSQQVYHVATVALAGATILQSIEDNVPGTPATTNFIQGLVRPGNKGGHLSDLGLIAFAGHLPSYLNTYTHRYKADKTGDKQGMGRMAATVRLARDPFSSGRKTHPARDRGWTFGVELGPSFLKLELLAISKGGSELRYKDKHFIWSAVDTAVLEGGVRLHLRIFHKTYKKYIDMDGPLGAGSSQARGKEGILDIADMPYGLGKFGTPRSYGGAAGSGHRLPWYDAAAEIAEKSVEGNPYKGLQPFRDVVPEKKKKKKEEILPFKAPYFFVGLVRKMDDLEKKGPRFAGKLKLPSGRQHDGELAAIAKAEVYFSRPSDLSYFRRHDGNREKPNLFSPFWQARLVDPTDIDRFLALAIQQKRIWVDGSDEAAVPGLKAAVKALEEILNKIL